MVAAMVLLFIIALIGDPYFIVCGIAVGLLARRPLHLLGAALIPIGMLLFRDVHNLGDVIVPAFIVAFIWAGASFLVKRAWTA